MTRSDPPAVQLSAGEMALRQLIAAEEQVMEAIRGAGRNVPESIRMYVVGLRAALDVGPTDGSTAGFLTAGLQAGFDLLLKTASAGDGPAVVAGGTSIADPHELGADVAFA